MEWKRILLSHLLTGGYTQVIMDRGKTLMADDAVSWHTIEEDLEAEVLGSYADEYYVDFAYDSIGDRLNGSCTCPFPGPCKHQVAVLLTAIDALKNKKERASTLPTISKAAHRNNNVPRTMENRPASTVRYLPLEDYHRMEDMIEACAPRRTMRHYFRYLEGEVGDDLTLYIEAFEVDWNQRKKVKFSVDIIADHKGIGIRCQSCASTTDRLCAHQYEVLWELGEFLDHADYFSQNLTMTDLYEQCMEPVGLRAESWKKYAKLKINRQGFYAEALASHIMPQNWVQKAMTARDLRTKGLVSSWEKRNWVDVAQDFERHGFLWGVEDFTIGADSLLRFMSGYAYKSKPGIKPQQRVIQRTATLFPEDLQSLSNQCVLISYDLDSSRAFEKMTALLSKHIKELNEVYHYVNPQEVFDDRITNKDLHLVQFSSAPLRVEFSVQSVDGLIEINVKLVANDEQIELKDMVYQNRFFFATTSLIYLYPHQALPDYLALLGSEGKVILQLSELSQVQVLVRDIRKYFEVVVDPSIELSTELLTKAVYRVYIQEIDDIILFEPMLSYREGLVNAFHDGLVVDGIHTKYIDESDRSHLLNFMRGAHPKFQNDHHHEGFLYLEGKDLIRDMWFLNFAEACKLSNIELLGHDQLKKYKYSPYRGSTSLSVSSGIDWFDVQASVTFGDEKVKPNVWIQAIRRGDNYVLLKDGSYGILPEEWLTQLSQTLKVAEVDKGAIRISNYRYNIVDELFKDLDAEVMVEVQDRRRLFNNYFSQDDTLEIPSTVTADLRAYQKEGFRWLNFLDKTNCGGILADDMGLGKTLQIISLLANQSEDQTSLVVVPRSLLYNWGAEIDKFCEPLIYLIHHGPQRAQLFDEIEHAQIIITTYDTLIRDVEMFKEPFFNYIILDESQAIKNPLSKRYKALRLLKARNRIAMTGTPIENNTFDLYAQLSFTSPGLLGSQTSFKENFAKPIDKEGDKDAAELLKKMIHPFILRRTKEQVAKDLPPKVEQTIHCDMGQVQRKLYDQLRLKIKSDLEASKQEASNKGQLKFKILEGLLRLRQMCNAPYLVNKALGASTNNAIKLEILSEQLLTATRDHKVLVFSQFVGMLTLIKGVLDKENIKYSYLDGKTRHRQAVVDEFQEDDSIKVFLISLKAGNTGLNLTKADYVYIVDPWWNPAAEAQAIDRTHRIGQEKPVFAYKLICRDTIEEKILELQQKKKSLASDIIKVDEDVFKQLDEKALMQLFD